MARPELRGTAERQALRRDGRRPAVAGGEACVQRLERWGNVQVGDSRGDIILILAMVKERTC
jgi:hypothetical protein